MGIKKVSESQNQTQLPLPIFWKWLVLLFSTPRAVDLDRQRRKPSFPRNFNQAGWISGRELKWLTLMGKIISARVNALLHWLRHCSVNITFSACKIPAQPLWLSPWVYFIEYQFLVEPKWKQKGCMHWQTQVIWAPTVELVLCDKIQHGMNKFK